VEFVRDAGGAAAVVQQPQAAADFSVAVSSSAVSIWQGGVSAPVSFSIIPHNGFSANVQVRFAGLPAGVTSIPASPFTTASGVEYGGQLWSKRNYADRKGQAVSFSEPDGGDSGLNCCCSSSYEFRSNTPAADNPSGEAHHRHIVYDARAKVSIQDITSTVDGTAFAVRTANTTVGRRKTRRSRSCNWPLFLWPQEAFHPQLLRHIADDSRKWFSNGDQSSHRRQARDGNIGGHEYHDRGFAGS